jgi:hypothetical protein
MTTLGAMSTAPDLAAVLDRIRGWAEANRLKPATLARQAQIAEVVTRDMADPAWSPSSKSIRRLEALIPSGWRPGDPVPAGASAAAAAAPSATSAGESP